jgi:hypothetical protein
MVLFACRLLARARAVKEASEEMAARIVMVSVFSSQAT